MRLASERPILRWYSFGGSCVSVAEKGPDFGQKQNENCVFFFLHGRFRGAETWSPLMDELATRFRCLAINFPGFENSFLVREAPFSIAETANLVGDLIKSLVKEDEKVVLVGHDTGGGVAQFLTAGFSDEVSALVLINTPSVAHSLSRFNLGLGGLVFRWAFSKWAKQIPSIPSSTLKAIQGFQDSWPWHYEQQAWRKNLSSYPNPVLLLWGGKDPLSTRQSRADLLQVFPEAYFFQNEDAGLWPSLEDPSWVASKIREFVFKTLYQGEIKSYQRSLSK